MLNKTWAFALALALAAAPVSSLLASRSRRCSRRRRSWRRRWYRHRVHAQRRECDGRNGCCKCQYTGGEDGPRRGEAFFAQCGRPRDNTAGKQQVSRIGREQARRTHSSRASVIAWR
jgi:hypothetical protein